MLGPLLAPLVLLFAAFPATTNYQLNSYGFGTGGGTTSTSTYALEGNAGELGGQTTSTTTYSQKPGFTETQQANVPKISTFDNGSGTYYNKLHFVIDVQSNPSDALYALQISTNSAFSSNVSYVKSDMTIGPSLALADYQTYAAFGGSGGANIIGLQPNTTYYLRAKATQGKFTESAYGPSASAATVNPSLAFSASPGSISFGGLALNTVINAPQNIAVTFATNGTSGGDVFINGLNGGLRSNSKNNTITSVSGNLATLNHGFGARVTAASGGSFAAVSPYNGASDNIGAADATIQKLLSASAPLTNGSGTVLLKAKASFRDPAATDYTETVILTASAAF